MENKNLTPKEYFLDVKNKLKKRQVKELDEVVYNSRKLADKCLKTGQIGQLKKLIFLMETADKEREIIKIGIDKYVFTDDVLDYIDNVAEKTVKIIELKNYPREIPDEIVEIIEKTKDLFGELYVVFTDYTGEVEKKVTEERRDKDPILFGSFQDKINKEKSDKWYFLGDWEDEYCDLTLEKMVNEMKVKQNKDILHTTNFPSLEDMKEFVYGKKSNSKKKKSFFSKIRTFLKREQKA